MKKQFYLGSVFSAYAAIASVILAVFPLVFAAVVLSSQINFTTILLSVVLIMCFAFFAFSFKKLSRDLFSWGIFDKDKVIVKTLFSKDIVIEYDKCCDVGVSYYVHGVLNSKVGTKSLHIYFSYSILNEQQKSNINLMHNSETFIKLSFNKKHYNYLIGVLPKKQAEMLKRSVGKTGDGSVV